MIGASTPVTRVRRVIWPVARVSAGTLTTDAFFPRPRYRETSPARPKNACAPRNRESKLGHQTGGHAAVPQNRRKTLGGNRTTAPDSPSADDPSRLDRLRADGDRLAGRIAAETDIAADCVMTRPEESEYSDDWIGGYGDALRAAGWIHDSDDE